MDTANPLNVLVVEDDVDAQANLRDILELDEYAVTAVGTAAEAFALLASVPPPGFFAIVLDRRLPDGYAEQFLPRFRQSAPQAQVIVVTGYAEVQGAISALRLGAADYILKPVNPDELRKRLGALAEQRRSAEGLRLAQQRALQAERLAAIGQVFTGLAHESRNALQRSQACLEMLARRVKDRPEALELIGRIQNAQNHLHRLYEEVRGYAAPLRVQYERVNLGDLLQEVWDHLEVARKGRRTHLRQEQADLDLNCDVDRHGLEQVFRNLLENSLAACADPVLVEAHWSETQVEGQRALRLALRDNGPGLSPEARQRIFEPFYTTKTQGTGLGMAIVQRIVEAHRGRIAVGADLKPGAEIVLELPREAQ